MSDYYNDYNSEPSGSSEFRSENEITPPVEQKPDKPRRHTLLKLTAFILALGIVGAGSVQVYKFMDDSKFRTSEPYNNESPTSPADEIEHKGKPVNATVDKPSASNAELPGLFDIAARTDAKYLPDIVDDITPSVVGISSTFEYTKGYTSWGFGGFQTSPEKRTAVGTGTGIISTEDGYIITNAHVIYFNQQDDTGKVIGEAKEVSVIFSDESEHEAKIIAYDVETDLAVLKIDETGLKPAAFGDSSELRVGELVIAVGNPLGFELFGSVTSGIVSALNRQISIDDKNMSLIQTDAAINSGNSGGPLLNSCGQVIGINSAKMSSSYGSEASVEGLGFAIPINDAKVIIDDLINFKAVTGRPQIGITGVDVTEAYSSYLGIPMGIYVRSVASGSAAENAGILQGDVIIGINDQAVSTMDELNKIKNTFKAGDTITLTVSRNGEDIDLDLTLQDANADKILGQGSEE